MSLSGAKKVLEFEARSRELLRDGNHFLIDSSRKNSASLTVRRIQVYGNIFTFRPYTSTV